MSACGITDAVSRDWSIEHEEFDFLKVYLKLEDDKPLLVVTYHSNSDYADKEYYFVVRGGYMTYEQEFEDLDGGKTTTFDLLQLSSSGSSYTIVLQDKVSGDEISLFESDIDGDWSIVNIQEEAYVYSLNINSGILELQYLLADYINIHLDLVMQDSTPILKFTYTLFNTEKEYKLRIGKPEADNDSNGTFFADVKDYGFSFDLTKLTTADNWYDIHLVDGDTDITIWDSSANMNAELVHNSKTYVFKEWGSNLKVQFSNNN